MALDSYAHLKTAVADWLNRADLAAAIPDFIAMAEAQLSRRLVMDGPVQAMLARSDLSLNGEFIALPADFMGLRSLYTGGASAPLTFVEPEKIDELAAQYRSLGGNPIRFAVVGTSLRLWPWNGVTLAGKLTYWQRIPALSEAAPSNWLLALHPDAYLYGALLQSAPYLKDDARLAVWGQIFEAVIADIVKASRIARSAPHLALSPVMGGTP